MIRFACEYCSRSIEVPDSWSGDEVQCRDCGHWVRIPTSKAMVVVSKKSVQVAARAIKQAPYLTKNGAVVECPGCHARMHASEHHFNRRLSCPRCSRLFIIIFEGTDKIPYICEDCLTERIARAHLAGKLARCTNCDHRILVPESSLFVRFCIAEDEDFDEPTIGSGSATPWLALGGLVLLSGLLAAGSRPSGWYCHGCGRYNYTPYCSFGCY
jgi:DNA-directed RNA polymerase subunit RPC12/RpoP